jgi:hypothetical protein
VEGELAVDEIEPQIAIEVIAQPGLRAPSHAGKPRHATPPLTCEEGEAPGMVEEEEEKRTCLEAIGAEEERGEGRMSRVAVPLLGRLHRLFSNVCHAHATQQRFFFKKNSIQNKSIL